MKTYTEKHNTYLFNELDEFAKKIALRYFDVNFYMDIIFKKTKTLLNEKGFIDASFTRIKLPSNDKKGWIGVKSSVDIDLAIYCLIKKGLLDIELGRSIAKFSELLFINAEYDNKDAENEPDVKIIVSLYGNNIGGQKNIIKKDIKEAVEKQISKIFKELINKI